MDHGPPACAGVIEDLLYQPARRRAVGHASVFDGQPDHLHAVGLRRGDEHWDTEQVELEVLEQGREQVDALRPKDIEISTEVSRPARSGQTRAALAGSEGQTDATGQRRGSEPGDAQRIGEAGSNQADTVAQVV